MLFFAIVNGLYYLQQYKGQNYLDGGVGNADLEQVWEDMGFQPIQLQPDGRFSLVTKTIRLLQLVRLSITMPAGAIIIFQTPVFATLARVLILLLNRKRRRIICHISDLDGVKDADDRLLKKELTFLRHFKYFLVHHHEMKKRLLPLIPHGEFAVFNYFSFLSDINGQYRQKDYTVAFAGNLAKSGFLRELPELLRGTRVYLTLYGRGTNIQSSHVKYAGIFQPQQLAGLMEESFGLIWDGDSAYGLAGALGHYQEWISPHKLSLYVMAGMPVIAHENAGFAALLKEYNIGVTVRSLEELQEKITSISTADYQKMRYNCLQLAEQIKKGEFLKKAIQSLLAVSGGERASSK